MHEQDASGLQEYMNSFFAKYCLFYPTVFLKGENVRKQLAILTNSQWHSHAQLRDIQQKKLHSLINYCKQYVPYYSDVLAHIDPDSPDFSISDLPVLSKTLLIEEKARLLSNRRHFLNSIKSTGGSTG